MGKSAFLLASGAAALAIFVLSLALLVFLVLGSRRAGRRPPFFLLGVGITGVVLMEAAAAAAVLTYRPFDPRRTDLHEACRRVDGPGGDEPLGIRFDYDASRQCQNHTFYEARPRGLERVVTQTRRQDSGRAFEADDLRFIPDFAEPGSRGVFTKTRRTVTAEAYDGLVRAKGDGALACPDPGDQGALTDATARAAALRARWTALPAAGQIVTRWRCSPTTVP